MVVEWEDTNMAPITKKHVGNLEEENLNQKAKAEAEEVKAELKAEVEVEVEVLQEELEKHVEDVDVKPIFHKQLSS